MITKKTTIREVLQLVGTEIGRNLHPNIWCNSLMSEYVSQFNWNDSGREGLPNWIITDMRFLNELEAVKNRQGINIRVNRPCFTCKTYEGKYCSNSYHLSNKHESETALDNAEFDYVIQNDNTLEDLIQKVREILILEKII